MELNWGRAILVALLASSALAFEAAAQTAPTQFPSSSGAGGTLNGPVVTNPGAGGSQTAAPPALPGAKSEGVVPLNHPTGDMQPTDALFDAITRGDIAAARDAITRGAELDARNVLGLTPLESAVDLRRNDIAFLLLSLRDAGRRNAAASAAAQAAPAREVRKPAHQPRPVVVATERQPVRPVAKQFAGDGGQPIPDAGFLGFGHSTTR